jgi:signal transduction histidine kinase
MEPVADTAIMASDLFFKSAQDSIPVMLLGCRVISDDTTSAAFLFAEIPASGITRIMLHENSKSGLGNSGEAYLAGADLMMRSESRFIPGSLLRIPVSSDAVKRAIRGETGAMVTPDYRGVQVFSAYEPLEIMGLKWVILAEIDYEEAMIPVTGLRNDIMLVSIVISLLILGFAQLISKMVTQPIIRLKNAAAGLGRGDFDHKVHVKARDEIGLLADTFNAMSDQLKEERSNRLIALFDGQEMERKRISRELHDGLGQKLVGTKLQIENCDEHDQRCLQTTLTGTKSQLHGIVEELRRISNDLMPAALVELGLEAAVKNLCNDFSTQSRIDVECDITLDTNPADQISVYLFRICQEGMQNIIKHAKASRVSLQLIENRDMLILIIEDNGAGFDPGLASAGNGLMNMKERSALLGGTFTIESEPGHGTTLRVKIPKTRP